jgi:predicted TIM-barrel fold metal-dependent hydrolase
MNTLSCLPAIDAHGHYGRYLRAAAAPGLRDELSSADPAEVARRAQAVNIELTLVSPLMALLPRGQGNALAGNEEAARLVAATPGLKQYAVIDPRHRETFAQAAEMLAQPQCVGIKIHPEEHAYPIDEHAAALFEFAASHRAVVLAHSSEKNSQAADYIPWLNRFPEVRLILAHIGCGWDGDVTHQVRAIQRSRHGNVFADTSSANSIVPGLIEWAVREVGADRVLFGTDTPLYHAAMQRARIEHAEIPEADKRLILRDNALRLFGARLGHIDNTMPAGRPVASPETV